MANQKRYYYIRAVVDGEKYRSQGFCDKSDFKLHLQRDLTHPFFYFNGYPRSKTTDNTVYSIEFWRADGRTGNHYFLGSLSAGHPSKYALPIASLYIPTQPIRFFKEECRDTYALTLKMPADLKCYRSIVVGKDKFNLPLGYHD